MQIRVGGLHFSTSDFHVDVEAEYGKEWECRSRVDGDDVREPNVFDRDFVGSGKVGASDDEKARDERDEDRRYQKLSTNPEQEPSEQNRDCWTICATNEHHLRGHGAVKH